MGVQAPGRGEGVLCTREPPHLFHAQEGTAWHWRPALQPATGGWGPALQPAMGRWGMENCSPSGFPVWDWCRLHGFFFEVPSVQRGSIHPN